MVFIMYVSYGKKAFEQMSASSAEKFLTAAFYKRHVVAMLRHFQGMTEKFQEGEWEDSIAKGGKFIEAAVKALYIRAGQALPKGRAYKVGAIINNLAGLPAATADDTIRVTIPRACRFVYDIASNRGGRHDPDEIDPNEMDSNTVTTNCSWILAEMIRHAQRGTSDCNDVKNIVDSLVRRRYPLIEEVDGRTYFHYDRASGVEVALVILFHKYPRRVADDDLVTLLTSNGFTLNNARTAVGRIKRFVDIDCDGRLLLLSPGLRKAEEIIAKASSIQK